MIRDRIFIGTMAGMIAGIVKDIPNFICYKLGIVKYLYFHLAASAHLTGTDIYSPLGYVIGVLSEVITSDSKFRYRQLVYCGACF